MIVAPDRNFLFNSDQMKQDFFVWTREVTDKLNFLDPASGSGSPEGVVEAAPGKLYYDTAGTAGNILYIKRDADIAGDKSQGWILV